MIQKETIQKILEAGVQAPSGSNSQPWRFEVADETVSIFMVPEKDHPVLNVNQWGTLFAIGALIENISITAGHYGLRPIFGYFPDKKNRNLVADLKFDTQDGNGNDEGLFDAIWKRATNRKPFGTEKIDGTVRQRFLGIPAEIGVYDVALRLADDRGQIGTLAHAASVNEEIIFQNKELHRLMMQEIVWTEEEHHERKSGLFLKTMELKPPQESALKLFRSWKALRVMNALFGVAHKIASDNEKGYAACSFYGGISCGTTDLDLVRAGQVAERAWLVATAMGLSFHLQTGVNFLRARLDTPEGERLFTARQAELIRGAYESVTNVFRSGDRFIPAIFRIGRDGEPSARSPRKEPEVVWKD